MIDYKKRRIKLGLSVEQVSEMTGLSARDIMFIEKGAVSPRLEGWYNLYSVLYNGNDGNQLFRWDPNSLYQLRTDAGMTQSQLAEKLGVNRMTVCRWEDPRKPKLPLVDQLSKICRQFGLLPKYFFKKIERAEVAAA